MATIYIAGPIDRSKDLRWDNTISQAIRSAWSTVKLGPCAIYSPLRAWGQSLDYPFTPEEGVNMLAANKSLLTRCDAMMLAYIKGTETWGCPMEAAWALSEHVPVIVWVDEKGISESAFNQLPIYLATVSHKETLYLSVESAVSALLEYLDNKNQMAEIGDSIPEPLRMLMGQIQ